MSYDLLMFAPVAGEDPRDTYERIDESEDDTGPDPETEARNRRIADALLEAQPEYEEFILDHDLIAEAQGITADEARASFRHIELSHEGGLQITLEDREASITFPYWESLDPRQLAREIEVASRIIAAETRWVLYDPQLEQVLDPVADAEVFAATFGQGVDVVRGVVHGEGTTERPSLLRRIFRRGS